MEGVRNGEAGQPRRAQHSPVENWRDLLMEHIRNQFNERGQLKPGRGAPVNQQDGSWGFANIRFRYDPNGDPEGRVLPHMYNITHFPPPGAARGALFYA